MNSLTVISVAALVASGSASLLAYNGVYGGHHGLLGAYPYAGYSGVVPYAYAGGLPAAAPLSLKTPVIKTLAPTPISYNVAPAPVSYNVAPAPVSYNVVPFAPVAPVQSQYHAQDEIGQYSFGYAAVLLHALSLAMPSVLSVIVHYVDSEGRFRLSTTWLTPLASVRPAPTFLWLLTPLWPPSPPRPEPVQDTAEPYPWASDSSLVVGQHECSGGFKVVQTVISVAALVASGSASLLAYSGVYGGHHGLLGAYPYAGYSGVVPTHTQLLHCSYNVAPVAPVQSQYHAQDEIGQYSFGYAGGASSRAESRDAFGVVRGSYNYVDSEGKVQTQHYVADPWLPCVRHQPSRGSRRPSGRPPGPVPNPVPSLRLPVSASTLLSVSPTDSPLPSTTPTQTTYASPLHYTAAHPALTTYNAVHVPTTYAAAARPPSVTPNSSAWSTTRPRHLLPRAQLSWNPVT
ncbi:cuticular protein precursor [Penaeus vannamei]|uniref:Cuticular protein n=1 Tax=Penaeus vannamei TaxID=6689 RepID=A0A423U8X8_PENVA|nr:cuticular protein precursor [Penaeus vannamei]